ncbi:MAG: TM0106 family RecB-like putative nuclease, partial [Rhodospirillales bacterium]
TRLRAQAVLQRLKQKTGTDTVEILPLAEARGFARLPQPDPGDIFFDMEGDPLFEGGLEYLFGLVHIEGGDEIFTPFWGHDREAEKRAFEATIDFIVDRFADYPDAHVYHYAAYEATALKNLAMRHGTREFAVDQMLRKGKLVDLYKAVREGIRVSEPRYSIKNLETFYWKGKRKDEITSAGQSVVIYEEWRQTKEDKLLEDIRRYNEVDCRSTLACRDWLLTLRPPETAWFTGPSVTPTDTDKEAERLEAEKRAQEAIAKLVAGAPEAELPWRRTLGY